jgi:hypothetical protein
MNLFAPLKPYKTYLNQYFMVLQSPLRGYYLVEAAGIEPASASPLPACAIMRNKSLSLLY